MASNGDIESEDNEITENNGDKVVTMMDVLQEQEDFEEDANAVLGASDDKNCTYPLGYIKRQAIYACMTCCSEAREDPSKRAGVCLACSLTCHENHELIELYTKRNFRCDCGNSKFNSNPCQFTPDKTDLNEENSYNQNFSGLYCVCHRPYPDPEATEEDEMIQCIICEDWLHASHLEAIVPSAQYGEMICKECMSRNEFLHGYSDLALNTENDFVDVMNTSNDEIELCNEDNKNETMDTTTSEMEQKNSNTDISQINESKTETDPPENTTEADGQLNQNTEDNVKIQQMESDVPMDSGDEKPNNENISTNAKDSEVKDGTCKGAKEQNSVSADATKIENSSDNTENKNGIEENIDSHINALKEIVESSEDDIDDNVVSTKDKDNPVIPNTDDSESKINEVKQSEDATPDTDCKQSENEDLKVDGVEQSEDDIPVKMDESNVDDVVPSENANTKTENQPTETIEANIDEVTPSENDIQKTENENFKPDMVIDPIQNENINDLNLETKYEEQNKKINNDNTILSENNTDKDIENINKEDTHSSPNKENHIALNQSSEDNQNVETPNGDTVIQTAHIKENSTQEERDNSKSAEELEKIEEDRLLADPDENEQEEKILENKNSEESISKDESKDENNEHVLEERINNKPLDDNTQTKEESNETVKSCEATPLDTTSNVMEMDTTETENNGNSEITEENKTKTVIESNEKREVNKDSEKSLSAAASTDDSTKIEKTVSNDTNMEVDSNKTKHSSNKANVEVSSEQHDIKRKLSDEDPSDSEIKKRKIDDIQCTRPHEIKRKYKGATFWPPHFRQKLCTCNECLSMYKDLSVLFLIDPEDTVTAYENLGKEKTNGKPISQYEKGLQALSSLDRIQQINVLTEYNKMRDKFLDFLKSFKDRRKIVTEEDVKAFFAGMKPKRRPDGVYFCR